LSRFLLPTPGVTYVLLRGTRIYIYIIYICMYTKKNRET
jgi:hypothetical protein